MLVAACQVKWKGLRDTFSEKVRSQNHPSGSGSVKGIRWKWFNNMEFIRETILHRATSTNIDSSNIVNNREELRLAEEDIPVPVHSVDAAESDVNIVPISASPVKVMQENVKVKKELSPTVRKKFKDSPIKRKAGVDRKIDLEILKMLKSDEKKDSGNVENNRAEDENIAYGKYIAATLSKFDGYHKSLAKMKISQVLFEVESGFVRNCPPSDHPVVSTYSVDGSIDLFD